MRNAFGKHCFVVLLLLLTGCGTAPSALDLSIINHYQSKTPSRSTALEIQVVDPQFERFVDELHKYAASKKIMLTPAESAAGLATRIVITNNDETLDTNSGVQLVRSYLPETDSLEGQARSIPTYKAEL